MIAFVGVLTPEVVVLAFHSYNIGKSVLGVAAVPFIANAGRWTNYFIATTTTAHVPLKRSAYIGKTNARRILTERLIRPYRVGYHLNTDQYKLI